MRAGSLDRRVVILRRSLGRNEYGEQVETYDPVDTVWAQRLDVTGREMIAAKETVGELMSRFRLRYRSDLYMTDRLSCDGMEYDITQVAEIGRREALDVLAKARVP